MPSYGSALDTRYGWFGSPDIQPPLLALNWAKIGLPCQLRIWFAVAATAALDEAGCSSVVTAPECSRRPPYTWQAVVSQVSQARPAGVPARWLAAYVRAATAWACSAAAGQPDGISRGT